MKEIYFRSIQHKYIFALANLDGENRSEMLCIEPNLYYYKKAAKKWRDEIECEITQDTDIDKTKKTCAMYELEHLYKRMIQKSFEFKVKNVKYKKPKHENVYVKKERYKHFDDIIGQIVITDDGGLLFPEKCMFEMFEEYEKDMRYFIDNEISSDGKIELGGQLFIKMSVVVNLLFRLLSESGDGEKRALYEYANKSLNSVVDSEIVQALRSRFEEDFGEYFVSEQHKYIFALSKLEPKFANKIIKNTPELYSDENKARKWRDEMLRKIHPDFCSIEGAEEATAKVNRLYESMTEVENDE